MVILNVSNPQLPRVKGYLDGTPVKFLLDSGAAISVINPSALPAPYRDRVSPVVQQGLATVVVGANGGVLDVMGQVNHTGKFASSTSQSYVT